MFNKKKIFGGGGMNYIKTKHFGFSASLHFQKINLKHSRTVKAISSKILKLHLNNVEL